MQTKQLKPEFMKKSFTPLLLLALAMALPVPSHAQQQNAAAQMRLRRNVLIGGRNVVVTTQDGATHYYFATGLQPVMMYPGEQFTIGSDHYKPADVKQIRINTLQQFLLDQDATTFDNTLAVDHGLLALRRNLSQEHYSMIVLPVDLTGAQITDAFGDSVQVAEVKGISEDDETRLEFNTLQLRPDSVMMHAGEFYLIKPSREPDLKEGARMANFNSSLLYGPAWLIPNVSLTAKQSDPAKIYRNSSRSTRLRFSGTYRLLDSSNRDGVLITNRKVAPGVYLMDDTTGVMVQTNDSAVVKGFNAWVTNISSTKQPLKFYIDGVNEDITSGISVVTTNQRNSLVDNQVYDLAGRRVTGALPKGIYIKNGKKFVVR